MVIAIDGVLYEPALQQPAKSTLTAEERNKIATVIDGKGVRYGLLEFTDFNHGRWVVADKRFHQLRDALIKADDDMHAYLKQKGVINS